MRLPAVSAGDSGGVVWQESFGGLDRRRAAGAGAVTAMENLCSDHSPLLASREKRWLAQTIKNCQGLGGRDALFWAADGGFYYDGVYKGAVSEGEKSFYCLNRYIVIWPDKLFYHVDSGEFGALEASVSAEGAVLQSKEAPGGLSDQANCLQLPGLALEGLFRAGQALQLSGLDEAENDQCLVLRAVEGDCLYFYDNSFSLPESQGCTVSGSLAAGSYHYKWLKRGLYFSFSLEESLSHGSRIVADPGHQFVTVYPANGEAYTVATVTGASGDTALEMETVYLPSVQSGAVTAARTVPDMDWLCQCGNRLWGAGGSSIYCCSLGDPKTWNNYEGTASDGWSVEVGSGGPFTGAFAFGGYPLFFKEDHIYRVYGTKPANYQLFDSETLGLEAGAQKSPAVVGQSLYYKSRAGFVAYSGGTPRLIDGALGAQRREALAAGSDGRKYYVSCREAEQWSLLVCDSLSGTWHREDASRAEDFVWCGGELYMRRGDELWMIGRVRAGRGTQEEGPAAGCEFGPWTQSGAGRFAVRRLHLRLQSEEPLTVLVEYDGSGRWEKAAAVDPGGKGCRSVQLTPRRCESFRLRLEGEGPWTLWALGWEYESGSGK